MDKYKGTCSYLKLIQRQSFPNNSIFFAKGVKSSFVYSQEDIKRIVEGMIQSKFDNIQTSNNMEYGIESMQENISGDISQMLDNVELFK